MSRLIDADEFIVTNNESFMRATYGMKGMLVEMCDRIRERINAFIDEQPTVDAVPVVRCKDCIHRDPEDFKCDCGSLERQGCIFPVADDYYCSYGERKIDES